jgi:hypothetical protein
MTIDVATGFVRRGGQIPELTACDTGDHRFAAITLSHVQC